MAANPHRATVVLDLGKPPVAHDVCLNLNALAEIEAEFKVNVMALLPTGMNSIPVGVREAVAIIHAGLNGTGKKVSRASVVTLLDPMKPQEIIAAAYAALNAAFVDPEPNPPQEGASPS